jgi:predicted  nucleic acid-binding Zn-ribbon protein
MKNTQALLKRTQKQLQAAKALLREKANAVARAEDEHAKDTAKLSHKTIKRTVKEIEQHRDFLKAALVK